MNQAAFVGIAEVPSQLNSRLPSGQMIRARWALRRGRECHRVGDDHRDRDR